MAVIAAVLVTPGCVLRSREILRVAVQSRQTLDSAQSEKLGEGEFRFGAREVLWATPHQLRVASRSVRKSKGQYVTVADRKESRRVFDFDSGLFWWNEGDELFRRRGIALEDYERGIELRKKRIDFLDRFMSDPEVRATADIELYAGADPPRIERDEMDEDGWHFVWCSAESGTLWRILVQENPSDHQPPWLAEQLLYHVLDLPLAASRDLAAHLEGFPMQFLARGLPYGGRRSVSIYDIRSLYFVPYEDKFFVVDANSARRQADIESSLRSAEIFEVLRHFDRIAEGVTLRELLLRLESEMQSEHLLTLEALWKRNSTLASKIDIMRLALRHDPESSLPGLRRTLSGSSGLDAIAAGEALLHEEHPAAFEFLIECLRGRNEALNLEPGAQELWAIRQLRDYSGLDLNALADIVEGHAPEDARDAEYRYWLRWTAAEAKRSGL